MEKPHRMPGLTRPSYVRKVLLESCRILGTHPSSFGPACPDDQSGHADRRYDAIPTTAYPKWLTLMSRNLLHTRADAIPHSVVRIIGGSALECRAKSLVSWLV